MKKFIFTLLLAIVSSVWMMSEASEWCMSVAKAGSAQNIRIGGTFQAVGMPCEADTIECPPCLTIALKSGGMHYLVSGDPHIVAILDTVAIGSFAIIEGNHYLEGHSDFINVTNIIFPETDIPQLAGEWDISRETISTPTGDGGTRWFSTHDVNYTNYVLADDLIYKVILDQSSGYAHYSDAVPYTLERKEDGTWLLTAEGLFSSSDPVEEGIPSPVTIYRLTEDEMEWMYAANGGDEGPNYYYQHLKRHKQKEDKLPSICDEWNIAKISNAMGPQEEIHTVKAALSTDTIIGTQKYVKLFEAGRYKGALREGTNRDIYYIPNGSAHEYLLYNFNANVGDTLSNLWYGGSAEQCPNGYNATVISISKGTPRVFTVEVEYIISDSEGDHIAPWVVFWTEGVGMSDGPAGQICPGPDCECSCGQVVLCAYKNGEHIYTSDLGKKYGCEYSYSDSDSIGEENQKLLGTWQIYKETLSGNEYNEQGELEYRTITQDVNDNYTYNFYDTKLLISCPTCFFFPKHYILTRLDDQMKWNLWVEDIFTLQNEPDSTYKYGQSTITIHELSGNLMEWEFISHDENKGPTTYYQYLRRVGTQGHDTIPLFVKDGPGTSTVDPADPNLIYAVLRNDMLIIRDFTGVEIFLTLSRNGSLFGPRRARSVQAQQSFTDSTSVELTEEGTYDIELTSESWNYIVVGSFDFNKTHEAVEIIPSERPAASKILSNGQLLIRIGDQLYTPSGVMVQ